MLNVTSSGPACSVFAYFRSGSAGFGAEMNGVAGGMAGGMENGVVQGLALADAHNNRGSGE